MKSKFCSNYDDRFAGAGKVIAGGKSSVPKMKLDEKDAGGLLGDTKSKT
jgi:hypothetical protein